MRARSQETPLSMRAPISLSDVPALPDTNCDGHRDISTALKVTQQLRQNDLTK
jgi:hypothetical protein